MRSSYSEVSSIIIRENVGLKNMANIITKLHFHSKPAIFFHYLNWFEIFRIELFDIIPFYLQSLREQSAVVYKRIQWHVEECSVAFLCN
jgi:hypothetical protein